MSEIEQESTVIGETRRATEHCYAHNDDLKFMARGSICLDTARTANIVQIT